MLGSSKSLLGQIFETVVNREWSFRDFGGIIEMSSSLEWVLNCFSSLFDIKCHSHGQYSVNDPK